MHVEGHSLRDFLLDQIIKCLDWKLLIFSVDAALQQNLLSSNKVTNLVQV